MRFCLLYFVNVRAATVITQANSNPFRPGNENVDPDGEEVEKTFPVINVHYDFSPSDLDITGFMSTARFIHNLDRRVQIQRRELRRDTMDMRRLFRAFAKAQRRDQLPSSFVQVSVPLDPTLYPEAPENPVINIAIEEAVSKDKPYVPANELKRLQKIEKQHLTDLTDAMALAEILFEQLQVLMMLVMRRGGPVRSSFVDVGSAVDAAALKAKVVMLVTRIPSGGLTAAQAIAGLYNVIEAPGIKDLLKTLQVPVILKKLNFEPKTPEFVRWQAGSLLSRLSGLPSVENQAEPAKGTNALVTAVLPRPSQIYAKDKRLTSVAHAVQLIPTNSTTEARPAKTGPAKKKKIR